MVELFESIFWETATQSVVLFVPILSVIIISKLIHFFIIRSAE